MNENLRRPFPRECESHRPLEPQGVAHAKIAPRQGGRVERGNRAGHRAGRDFGGIKQRPPTCHRCHSTSGFDLPGGCADPHQGDRPADITTAGDLEPVRQVRQSGITIGRRSPKAAGVTAGSELAVDPQLQPELALDKELRDVERQDCRVAGRDPQPSGWTALADDVDAVAGADEPGEGDKHPAEATARFAGCPGNIKTAALSRPRRSQDQGASGRCRSSAPPGRQSLLVYPSGMFG
jgi:hypothetical protein